MACGRLRTIRGLYRAFEVRECYSLLGSSRNYSNGNVNDGRLLIFDPCRCNARVLCNDLKYRRVSSFLHKGQTSWNHGILEISSRGIFSSSYKCGHVLPWTSRNTKALRCTMAADLYVSIGHMRLATTQAKAPPQARQMGSFKVSMSSPGIIYEPYMPREPIPFWRRWFTRSGWRRTKEEIISELRSAYAIAKLRKFGYSKQKFYKEALDLYKEINTQISAGNNTLLRKKVTEKLYSGLKNEIKQRESMWSKVYWELVEPVVKIRTLRARLIGIDRNDVNKVFIQLTLEFLTKQKFEAYDAKGTVVAGDKNKEVLVRDIWVFEKSSFHPGAYWRLCGRINL